MLIRAICKLWNFKFIEIVMGLLKSQLNIRGDFLLLFNNINLLFIQNLIYTITILAHFKCI